MDFNTLHDGIIYENKKYQLNAAGRALMREYYYMINNQLREWVAPDRIFEVLSLINVNKIGNIKFRTANRIDTMTNGMSSDIDGNLWTFNENDPVLKYIELKKE